MFGKVGENVSNKLKDFRKNRDLTQIELAKDLHISNDYLSSIERGVKTPGFKLSKKIADYFESTVDEIFFNN